MRQPGLIVAPLTPFTADLKVDEPALRRQIDYVVRDCGATMVVAAGVETQEYTYLSLAGLSYAPGSTPRRSRGLCL